MDGSAVQMFGSVPLKLGDSKELWLGNASDFYLSHDGTNNFIIANNGPLYIRQTENDQDIYFECDDGSGGTTEYYRLDGSDEINYFSKSIKVPDNIKLMTGSSQDLEIYHDGADTFYNGTTGDMYFINKADDKDIVFQSDNGSGGYTTYFHLDGGTSKSIFSKPVQFTDSTKLFIGSSNDLEIFHDSSNTYLENYTGNFIFTQALDDGDMIFKCDNGSGGTTPYIALDGGTTKIEMYKYTRFQAAVRFTAGTTFDDNSKAIFGDDSDLEIFHDGSHSRIKDVGSGHLVINATDFVVNNSADTKNMIIASDGGSVNLYYNASQKFRTVSTGAEITGDLTLVSGNVLDRNIPCIK